MKYVTHEFPGLLIWVNSCDFMQRVDVDGILSGKAMSSHDQRPAHETPPTWLSYIQLSESSSSHKDANSPVRRETVPQPMSSTSLHAALSSHHMITLQAAGKIPQPVSVRRRRESKDVAWISNCPA